MSKHTDRVPTRRPAPIAQIDFARRAGVDRSTISRLFQGHLRVALLAGKRCDATHPEVIAWARRRGLDPNVLLGKFGHIEALTRKQEHREPARDVPQTHAYADAMTIEEFAARAEVAVGEVLGALRGELAPALLDNGQIDARSHSALTFMAARPFRVGADGRAEEPLIEGRDFLAAAAGPSSTSEALHIEGDHPALFIWMARLTGKVRA